MTTLAATENARVTDLLRSLGEEDWTKPTDCPAWDVRALAGHVLGGMEAFASLGQFVHQMRAGGKAAGDGPFIDGMTAVQVRERADLTTDELIARIDDVGPRVARARAKVPGLLRKVPMKEEVGGVPEKGGTFIAGGGGDHVAMDATEFCRVLSGRATGAGLLTQEVPF